MVNGTAEATRRLGCQISGDRWYRLVVVARVVGEFDGDRLGGTLWNGAVQLLDCPLGLHALVEPDESDAFGQT